MHSINNVLQGHVSLKALESALRTQGNDISTGRALEGANALNGFVGGAVGDENAVGAAKAQAVSTGEQQRVFKELQADWTGQL